MLLLIVAFVAFLFVTSVIASQVINSYNHSVSERQQELRNQADGRPNIQFSGSNGSHTMSLLHFLTLFIFIALLRAKKFLIPAFLTLFYAIVFIYGLSVRYYGGLLGGEEFSPKVGFLERLLREANTLDYLAGLFISILLIWQILILMRIFIKTLQRKNLPE